MKKFAVFSGFLGSGKTTTMMKLAEKGTKTAMITNDLGGNGLADHKLAQFRQCNAVEITGDCICYQTESLVAKLDELFEKQGNTLVISDIPGFGVGALDHVYHTLQEQYKNRYELAPFTVLAEPKTVQLLQNGTSDLGYILHHQLVEADLIVLNKSDILTETEKLSNISYLKNSYPQAQVLAVSALTGEGMDELYQALMDGKAALHRPDIGYGGKAFTEVMSRVCEYNLQYHAVVCCNNFDGNDYLNNLASEIQSGISTKKVQIPHMKLLAWEPEGEYGKVDLLDADRPIEVNQRFTHPCTELAVALNASAFGPASEIDTLITTAVEQVSKDFQLDLMIYRKELI